MIYLLISIYLKIIKHDSIEEKKIQHFDGIFLILIEKLLSKSVKHSLKKTSKITLFKNTLDDDL